MSENSSEPSYTNEIPIVNNFNLRNYLSNRDSLLREIRDCIISKEEERCRTLSKQVHAHWKSLSTRNGCIIVDNRVAFPNSIKEAVTDVLHFTHPRSWGMIELEKCIWWAFCNRDLFNRVCLCKAWKEFGRNLKPILPANKVKPLTPCVKPNQEFQLDFAGPTYDGQKNILVCIDRFSKCPTVKTVKNLMLQTSNVFY